MSTDNPTAKQHRPIRSYVLREGRMTRGQVRAMDELWPIYGLSPDAGVPLDFDSVFGRKAPVVLEIGFGDGDALAQLALANPQQNFIGIEVHTPGVGSLLLKLEQHEITNVRVFNHDAVEILDRCIGDSTLDRVQLFFPDPWHKKRHHKRRILSDDFVNLLNVKMRSGGIFHFASDWQDYAEQALERLQSFPGFTNCNVGGGFSPRPEWRPQTKFERRGLRLGHGVWDILVQKRAESE